MWNDGSANRGTRNGGAAAVVTRGSSIQPEVVTTIKTKGRTFTSSYEEEAAAMESHYPGHLPTPTILQSPYSFAQTVSPSVKLSFNPILRHSQSTILYCLPSSFNGSLAILLFQVTILQTKQLKKPPPCPQIQFFLFFYLVPFSLLTKPFVTL